MNTQKDQSRKPHSDRPLAVIYMHTDPDCVDCRQQQVALAKEWIMRELGKDAEIEICSDLSPDGRGELHRAIALASGPREGVLIVQALSRLSYTYARAYAVLYELMSRGWRFVSLQEGIDTADERWQQYLEEPALPQPCPWELQERTRVEGAAAASDRARQ